jgi:hypothetical protein
MRRREGGRKGGREGGADRACGEGGFFFAVFEGGGVGVEEEGEQVGC